MVVVIVHSQKKKLPDENKVSDIVLVCCIQYSNVLSDKRFNYCPSQPLVESDTLTHCCYGDSVDSNVFLSFLQSTCTTLGSSSSAVQ